MKSTFIKNLVSQALQMWHPGDQRFKLALHTGAYVIG